MARYNINNKEYISVTELTGMLDKGDPMLYWAGKMALETGKPDGFKDFRNETKDTGNDIHGLIENYINCYLLLDSIIYIPEISLKDYTYQVKRMFEVWLKWRKKHVKKFLRSELIVVNEKLCYAGTLDCIYINNNNEICVIDWKTKDAIYDTDGLQVVAYKNAIESMLGEYYIIRRYTSPITQIIEKPKRIHPGRKRLFRRNAK